LYKYIEADYRKIEPLDSDLEQRQFLAVLLSKDEEEITAIFELNTSQFIEEILRPVILEAAGEEFAISCNATNDIHNFNFDETIEGKQAEVTSPLWLIPNYELGIILKGRTLGGLIAERTYTNLIIIILMTIVIVGGVIIIYRNIQKEIKLAQIKSDFVSNVSHELRTPLALISMYSETLELGRIKTEEKKAEYYKVISQESNRLSRIVNSILSFSKIESGKRHYNFQTVNLNDIVERVYENYKFHLENMGFTFNFIKEENLPRLNLDREAVTESIINLVDNAAKYSKENKFIELKTMMYKGKPTVEVIDKGIGIAKDDQRKIFEKFFRVSTGLVHDTKGTGLGLTIVKHVLDAHNAVIELDSQEGNGTTFRIIFSLNKIN
jgi:two-component system phosphate regulon sensor histidine kinase PhoR